MSAVSELLHTAVRNADVSRKRVERVAALLAEELQRAHGGEFRIDVDHEFPYVVVRPT